MPTAYDYTVPGDSCLTGAGAFCKELGFWYFIECPAFAEQSTLRNLSKKSSQLMSINSLEHATRILLHNPVIDSLDLLHMNPPPYPKF